MKIRNAVAVGLFLAGCGNDWIVPEHVTSQLTSLTNNPNLDGGSDPDSGVADPPDSGVDPSVDSGTVLTDAGTTTDAGTVTCNLNIPSTGGYPSNCTRLNWPFTVPVTVNVGNGTVTITDVSFKTDESNQVYSLSYTSTVPVGWAVKAGTQTFYGDSSPYLNPYGSCGDDVAGVSNLTLCPCE
jgi:hypothetical protein